MKKILILLLLCSCKDKPMERPFVIIDMRTSAGYRDHIDTIYTFQDKNGVTVDFEGIKHFEVGDTIK